MSNFGVAGSGSRFNSRFKYEIFANNLRLFFVSVCLRGIGAHAFFSANSLHYVEDQAGFIRGCELHMKQRHAFLIVEYDTSRPSRWVPYPVSRAGASTLFERAGYASIRLLRSLPSIFRRAPLYTVAIRQS
ncbi:MAG TPA: hypothetical protein VD833_17155 [Vicinamibacterales bacterium]|nr:hypothetical protein [Vicinamibacterales bacterium]